MAIIRLGAVVNAISGSIGGTTFAHTKGGTIARAKLRQTTKTKQNQLGLRNDMSRVRQAWRDLTEIQRVAWRTVALQLPRANRLGQHNVLSGYQLFMRTNMDGRISSEVFTNHPSFTDPPAFISQAPIDTFDVVFSIANGYFYSATTRVSTPNNLAAMYGARTFKNYKTNLVPSLRMFFQGSDLFTPQNITAPWNAFIGEPAIGEFVFVRFRWTYRLGGLYNLPLDFRVQVTA